MKIRGMFGCLTAALGFAVLAMPALAAAASPEPLKIGIIGTGNIGSSLATHWAKAGHELVISGLDPEALKPLAAQLGPKVRVGTPREAAAFGTVVLISVPYKALPQVGGDYAKELAGKVVLDTCNPYPERDGAMADEARAKGTGVASKAYLPGTRLVRAFNSITYLNLRSQAFRSGDRAAIPLAGDDKAALAVASRLVSDAGFDPVIVGGLDQARRFDVGSEVYVKLLSAAELRTALKMP
ncbi:MAG TPA: NAD(P)-binding domain-containing protein [Steroidobacteraceae bacterium]|nr:NAD(P)-binding domain-containing protein [Steroidobacteraceae bacterium]